MKNARVSTVNLVLCIPLFFPVSNSTTARGKRPPTALTTAPTIDHPTATASTARGRSAAPTSRPTATTTTTADPTHYPTAANSTADARRALGIHRDQAGNAVATPTTTTADVTAVHVDRSVGGGGRDDYAANDDDDDSDDDGNSRLYAESEEEAEEEERGSGGGARDGATFHLRHGVAR